jgi:ubiquinone biosynthesis accessory factor UbiJ
MAAVPLPLAQAALASLNHLLRQQAWARDKLRAHAGRTVRMVVSSPLGTVLSDATIAPDGTLADATGDVPGVTLTLEPSVDAVFGWLREGPRGLSSHLKVEGDVMFAAAVGEVAQHLRWEVEEDLSRVLGDRAAHQVGEAARAGARQAGELRTRMESGVRQYLVDEARTLVSRPELLELRQRLRSLEGEIERLEQRIGIRPD